MKLTYKCKECGEPILTHNGLVSHITNYHKIQQKDYYDKHLKQEGEGKCLAATQQPWITAMELPWNSEPGLADIPVLVKKTEIHILK